MSHLFLINLFMIILIFISCGKEFKSPSTVKIKFDIDSSRTTYETTFIVVNITGPGISPRIYYNWEQCHSYGCTDITPPSSIELTVPSGADRRVQIMAIKDGKSQGGETIDPLLPPTINENQDRFYIYYGQQNFTFNTPTAEINMNLQPTSATGHVPRDIVGRYLTTANSGPTGIINVYYVPSVGENLLIEKLQMFNGWFNFFSADNLKLVYKLASTGETLFDTTSSLEGYLTSSKIMRIDSPSSFWVKKDSTGDIQEVREQGYNPSLFYGFFGPGVTDNHVVCYPQTDLNDNNVYINTSPYGYSYGQYIYNTNTANYTPLKWYSSIALSAQSPSHLRRIGGGVVDSDSRCLNGTELTSTFQFDYRRFGGNQGAAIKVDPPLVLPTFTSSDLSTWTIWDATSNTNFVLSKTVLNSVDPTKVDIKLWWEFLPGVSSSLGGVHLFYAYSSTLSSGSDNDCNLLKDSPLFTLKNIPLVAGQTSYKETALTTVTKTSLTSDYIKLYLCPYYYNDEGVLTYSRDSYFQTEIRYNNQCSSILSSPITSSTTLSEISTTYLSCALDQYASNPTYFSMTTPAQPQMGDIYLFYTSNNNGEVVITKTKFSIVSTMAQFSYESYTAPTNWSLTSIVSTTDVYLQSNQSYDFYDGNRQNALFSGADVSYDMSHNLHILNGTFYKKLNY